MPTLQLPRTVFGSHREAEAYVAERGGNTSSGPPYTILKVEGLYHPSDTHPPWLWCVVDASDAARSVHPDYLQAQRAADRVAEAEGQRARITLVPAGRPPRPREWARSVYIVPAESRPPSR